MGRASPGVPGLQAPEIDPHMLLPPSQSRLLSHLLLVLLFASFIHQAARFHVAPKRQLFILNTVVVIIIIITTAIL